MGAVLATEEMESLLSRCASSDWRERVAALAELTDFTQQERPTCTHHVLKVSTALAGRLVDSNNKVVLAAAHTTGAYIGQLRGEAMDRCVPVLLPCLALCLVSQQRPVCEASGALVERLLTACDPGAILAPLVGLLKTSANARVRVIMLEKLSALIPALHARRPAAVARHALPAIFGLIDESKPDVKTGATDVLLRAAVVIGKEGVLEAARSAGLPEPTLLKIKKLIKS
jgi:hypothetical protein